MEPSVKFNDAVIYRKNGVDHNALVVTSTVRVSNQDEVTHQKAEPIHEEFLQLVHLDPSKAGLVMGSSQVDQAILKVIGVPCLFAPPNHEKLKEGIHTGWFKEEWLSDSKDETGSLHAGATDIIRLRLESDASPQTKPDPALQTQDQLIHTLLVDPANAPDVKAKTDKDGAVTGIEPVDLPSRKADLTPNTPATAKNDDKLPPETAFPLGQDGSGSERYLAHAAWTDTGDGTEYPDNA